MFFINICIQACKCLVPVLEQLTTNKYTFKGTFKFASEIDYYLDFIQQRNQIFRAEVESSKLGHQFLSLLNKDDIFHSEKMVELNRLL